MDDLISRQAAIDAIRKIYDSVGILGEKWAVDKCQMAIKDLPSAQPEQRQRHGQYEQDGRRGAGMSWISREDLMEWLETEEDA